jgi:hypothetical protein
MIRFLSPSPVLFSVLACFLSPSPVIFCALACFVSSTVFIFPSPPSSIRPPAVVISRGHPFSLVG